MGGGSSGEDTGGGGFNWNSLYSGGGYGVQTGGDSSHEAGTGLVHHGGTNWRIPLAGGDSSHEAGEDNSVLPPFGGGDSGDSSSQEKIFGGGGIVGSSGGKSSGGGDSSSGGLKPRPPLPTLPTVEPGSGKGKFEYVSARAKRLVTYDYLLYIISMARQCYPIDKTLININSFFLSQQDSTVHN